MCFVQLLVVVHAWLLWSTLKITIMHGTLLLVLCALEFTQHLACWVYMCPKHTIPSFKQKLLVDMLWYLSLTNLHVVVWKLFTHFSFSFCSSEESIWVQLCNWNEFRAIRPQTLPFSYCHALLLFIISTLPQSGLVSHHPWTCSDKKKLIKGLDG